jgi:poly(A) polymerase
MSSPADRPTREVLAARAAHLWEALPPEVMQLAELFAKDGHEFALVGGPVRDAFLGRSSADLDFTTSARPEQTENLIKQWTKTTWDMGREFGTIGGIRNGVTAEITTYRADEYNGSTRKPTVAFGDSLEGDLARRDFTVNAMAVRLPTLEFIDPFGGLEDLAGGLIRTPVEPSVSFGDDPLRMMRAARFVSQLGFEIEPATFAAASGMAERIGIVSAERVRD